MKLFFSLLLSLCLFIFCSHKSSPISGNIENEVTEKAFTEFVFALEAPGGTGNSENSPIQLDHMYIDYMCYCDFPVPSDTIKLSGPPPQTITHAREFDTTFYGEINVRVFDINDSLVYTIWEQSFRRENVNNLVLHPNISSFDISIYPIPHYVNRCELWLDNKLFKDTLIDPLISDELSITYDYLKASFDGITHTLSINLFGIYNGTQQLLYNHSGSFIAISGKDWDYNADVAWVGPPESSRNSVLQVKMGNPGKITITAKPIKEANHIIFWNKLESTQNPDGDPGEVLGSPLFVDAVFGKGLRTPTGHDGLIFRNVIQPNQGTIQFWWVVDSSEPIDIHPVLINNAGTFSFRISKNTGERRGFSFQLGNNHVMITNPYLMKQSDRIFIGCTWKKSLDLLELSMHVFINDTLNLTGHKQSDIYENTEQTDPYTFEDIIVGSNNNDTYYPAVKSYGIIDNLKVFKQVKKDFPDRYTE
jgi:hypothetical protein